MRSITLDAVRIAHALGVERTGTGTVFNRFPAWTASQQSDVSFAAVAGMPAGVRLEMTTDTSRIELDVMLTHVEVDGTAMPAAAFDLVADGDVVATQRSSEGLRIVIDSLAGSMDVVEGPPCTIVFDGVPTAEHIEIWLPQGTGLELLDLRVDDGAAVAPPAPTRQRRWVHHGSSISHCMEADQPTGAWPAVAARLAGVDLHNLAVAGECQLDPFTARTIRDIPADLVSLKLGINVLNGDTMRERTFVPAVHGFLDTIREGHPTVPILVVTPIFCPSAEDRPGPTLSDGNGRYVGVERPAELAAGALTLRRIRELLEQIVAVRRELGDAHLHVLDGLALFGADEVDDLLDDLHPNAAGYRRMGERFHRLAFVDGPFAAG